MESILEGLRASFSWDAGAFVHFATLGYVLGFLLRNQLALRCLVMIATGFYILYYYYFPAEPLWGGILGSTLIAVANIIGTIFLIYDRLPIKISEMHMPIFKKLQGVEPRAFRRLIKIGELFEANENQVLAKEGEELPYLYYILSGKVAMSKGQKESEIPPGCFIGEVSFILQGDASATVTVLSGAKYMRWERYKLQVLLNKSSDLRQSFEALIGRDMAAKVAGSHPTMIVEEAIA